MQLRRATMADFDRIIAILKDGANQLAERGVDQWQGDYPSKAQIKEDIENGWAFLAVSEDQETVGAIAIVDGPDHVYDHLDGKWLADTNKYVVIHRVAIHSQHSGKGYATKLLQAVINDIKNNRDDIDSIRIDTHEDNKAMQHLIAKMGFSKVGYLHGAYRLNETSYVYELLK
ncbi:MULTISPECIES: GNAT family N-acetyltransferase [unclassified Lactobacillus]|uniref:GNAT family N-acetyltransferase n=1 Tax=unclassified Lactobacillus TaxID=2620435 RepID=UPI0018DEC5F7|nr:MULTISPECIES: GNAT family N-acetyltransferase [unclassified Lactobacillus]MBH9989662.1 GNAT family N-acetyltransferase [Lactobacillus sp. M0392]MBI0023365.1 GNAT family N-acetyltransferase [Lactobacillus sp. W8171]MBI0044515.1 GNAT family N-acetyltransferase [Lactobacillus sp. M0393]